MFVLLLGLARSQYAYDTDLLGVVGFTFIFIAEMILFGLIVSSAMKIEVPDISSIIKNYLAKYLLVSVILVIPTMFLLLLFLSNLVDYDIYNIVKNIISLILAGITMYVIPIVFIKRQHVIAILAGVVFFFRNIKESLSIVAFVVFFIALNNVIGRGIEVEGIQHDLVSILAMVINVYLRMILFAAATVILLRTNNIREDSQA